MPDWILFALGSAGFAALVAIFGKIGITGIDNTLATTVRAIIMAIFLTVVSLGFGKLKLISTISSKPLLFIIFSGVAGALSWLCYFLALSKGPATGVAALDRLSVVFVVVFSVLFLSEQLTWKTGLGASLITAGALLMTFK